MRLSKKFTTKSQIPDEWVPLYSKYTKILSQSKWRDLFDQYTIALFMIPKNWQQIFSQYFALVMKYKKIKEAIWKKEFSSSSSSDTAEFSDQSSTHFFERNPITYLMYSHNLVIDFPGELNRTLRLIHHQSEKQLTKDVFLKILDMIKVESEVNNNLTKSFKELFRILLLYPLASIKELANYLQTTPRTTPRAVQQRIERFRNRLSLNRIIQLNYYKVGLSRTYLFLMFRNRQLTVPTIPVTTRYFEKEIIHYLDVFSDLFVIQSYYTPKVQWNQMLDLCKKRFRDNEVRWLGDEPLVFYAEDLTILYNLNTYDSMLRKWCVNEEYLTVSLSTDLWQSMPRVDTSPALRLAYQINEPRLEFDKLDLDIIHYFYELEGNNNRFSTIDAVRKALGIPYNVVKTRLKRMLDQKMVTFFYYTFFCLPRSVNVIILGEDPKICEQYLNIVAHVI